MWIENCSLKDICTGNHCLDEGKTVLIQIVDIGAKFPTPKYKDKFRNIYKYQFDDLDKETDVGTCSWEDAKNIANRLQHAYDNKLNVVVHCHAGLCRSGAVVQAGINRGFDDTGKLRIPNILVLNKINTFLNPELADKNIWESYLKYL